ncbi:MAG: ACT domain-containing protein [Candidatus Freyrarchaeum guaymaensis]|nr:ACT domain-containing protein [Candidatus Sigynarchaeota archaeon]
MRMILEIELLDEPGQLVKALEPISSYGGNIREITHLRDRKRGNSIPVIITFDLEDKDKLESITQALKRQDIPVIRAEPVRSMFGKTVILVGHVFATNIKDTIDRILETQVIVKEVTARIKRPEEVSTVKFRIEAETEEKLEETVKTIRKVGEEKNLFVVWS